MNKFLFTFLRAAILIIIVILTYLLLWNKQGEKVLQPTYFILIFVIGWIVMVLVEGLILQKGFGQSLRNWILALAMLLFFYGLIAGIQKV